MSPFPHFTHPVPISALAALLGCTRSTIRHFADRLGFRFTTTRLGVRHKRMACLAPDAAAALAAEVQRDVATTSSSEAEEGNREAGGGARSSSSSSSFPQPRDVGVIYLLQLEPELDPGRFKLGFSSDLEGRFDDLRTVAPLARLIAAWPACRSWERIAIISIAQHAHPLAQEVFRCESLEAVIAAAERFFAVMPRLDRSAPPASASASPPDADRPSSSSSSSSSSSFPSAPARPAHATAPTIIASTSAPPTEPSQSPPAITEPESPHPPPHHLRDAAAAASAPPVPSEEPLGFSRSSPRSAISGLHPSQPPPPGAAGEKSARPAYAVLYGLPP